MSLNPLAPVTDYQSMLNRIFWFTSASALAAIWVLRIYIPELNDSLSRIDFAVALGSGKLLPIPGGYLLPALALGIVTRVFRLHARISDLLAIREWFDVEVIIGEFAKKLEIDLTPIGHEQLRNARHSIMRKAFYPFVSGSKPQIDRQLIQQALDSWSWFWVGVEATLVFSLAGLGLIAGGAYTVGFQMLGGAIAFALFGLPAIHRQCQRYARAQVRVILADLTRRSTVHSVLVEISGEPMSRNLAA